MRFAAAILLAIFFSHTVTASSAVSRELAQTCARILSALPSLLNHEIELANGQKVPLHRGLDGKTYVYIFPLVKTEVTFIETEPYVTVYRGLRGKFDPRKASGNYFDHLFIDPAEIPGESADGIFGDNIYTSLSSKVALSYLTRKISFTTPRDLTLLRLHLPLKKAFVAKRHIDPLGNWESVDEYVPALENRNYIWFRWKAWNRMRELELVWNMKDLDGGLLNPVYQLKAFHSPVAPDSESGEYTSYDNWYGAQAEIERSLANE